MFTTARVARRAACQIAPIAGSRFTTPIAGSRVPAPTGGGKFPAPTAG